MKRVLTAALFAISLFAASFAFAAENWTQFRGPDGQGQSDATGLPLTWSETEHVTWKTPIPGRGHSSPVVFGDQVWLTTSLVEQLTPEEKKARLDKIPNSNGLDLAGAVSLRAICVDRKSGQLVHNLELFHVAQPEPIHSLNSYASPTSVIEEGRLYCHFGTYGTCCVDTKTAKIIWSNTEHHCDHQNGAGSSPIVWNDLLIVHYDGIDVQYIVAMNKATGDTVWKTNRSGKLNDRIYFKKAYGTPVVVQQNGKPLLISPGADWVYGYDPATGKEIWRAGYGKLGFSTVPVPLIGPGEVYICTSFMQSRLLAVKWDGQGDVTDTKVRWAFDKQMPKKPSGLLIDGLLYFVADSGVATCIDAQTGEAVWTERLGGNFSASPLYVDGRIYCFNQEGQVKVLAPGRSFKELAAFEMDEGFMATPAVAGKAMFARTDGHLYRIEK